MQTEEMKVYLLDRRARAPVRGTAESIGYDVHAFLLTEDGRSSKMMVPPRITRKVPTGVAIVPPPGWSIMVCPRSGLAERGLTIVNAPGIIDPDYTGEVQILMGNLGHEPYYIQHGDRIAQLVLHRVFVPMIVTLEGKPPENHGRGSAGFGSTGR